MKANVIEILKRAKVTVTSGWTQGTVARDESGFPCPSSSPYAVAWCATGSIYKQNMAFTLDETDAALAALDRECGNSIFDIHLDLASKRIQGWNDEATRTKEDVLAALDAAIAATEGSTT